MKVKISEDGNLIVSSESNIENYLIMQWMKKSRDADSPLETIEIRTIKDVMGG